MIFTHCGLLGDFMLSWPIASWYYKKTGEKIHFVLPDIACFSQVDDVLKEQPFTGKITKVNFKVGHFSRGGQPYNLNPADFGILGEYVNLGFWEWPNKYCAEVMAEEHGLGVDYDYTMEITLDESTPKFDKIVAFPIVEDYDIHASEMTKRQWGKYMLENFCPKDCHILDLSKSLHENLKICKNSNHVYCSDGGISIALDLMRKTQTVYYKERETIPGELYAFGDWFEPVYYLRNNSNRHFIAIDMNIKPKAALNW
jgi:hypothetical protein